MKIFGRSAAHEQQRSSLESFLDEYQVLRVVVNSAAVVVSTVLLSFGWWHGGSASLAIGASLVIVCHGVWSHRRGIRAPRTMLAMDTTLIGVLMLSLSGYPSVISALFAFAVVLVVFFTQGWWMSGFLVYATAWFAAAALRTDVVDPIGNMDGSLFLVAALGAVVFWIRRWLGILDANRSQMLGTVSHELRNSLTGVLGFTELVSTLEGLEPEEAREMIEMAHTQALDANEIVEDLLTVSRVEREALRLHSEAVHLNEEVEKTAKRFGGTDREVGLLLAEELPPAWADALRVRQAVRNLLSNAVRYGGPTITVMTRLAGGSIEVIVRDDGEGVPPEEEQTIFLPYRRSTTGRRDASSIGLGLWVCRQLAHAMGGALTYRRVGDFTEFVLTLPVANEEQSPGTGVAPAVAARSRGGSELDDSNSYHSSLVSYG